MQNLIVNGNIYCGEDAYFIGKPKKDKSQSQIFGNVEVDSDLYINCKVESYDYLIFQDLNKLENLNIKPSINMEKFNGTIIDAETLRITGKVVTSKDIFLYSDKLHGKLRLEKIKRIKNNI